MKIKCVSCSSILSVDREQLRKAERPIISCCECQQKMLIQPRAANCGSCNEKISYYEHQLNPAAPYIKCDSCKVVNRMPLSIKNYQKF